MKYHALYKAVFRILCAGMMWVVSTDDLSGQPHWRKIDLPPDLNQSGPPIGTLMDMAFCTDSIGFIATRAKGLWRTSDAAQTWTQVIPKGIAVCVLDSVNVFAIGENGFYSRSRDAGVTWDSLQIPGAGFWRQEFQRISFADTNYGFAGGGWGGPPYDGSGIFAKTSDGGQTWKTKIGDPLINELYSQLLFADSLHGMRSIAYVSSYDNYFTKDGGESWSLRPSGGRIHMLADKTYLMLDRRSTDLGASWHRSANAGVLISSKGDTLYSIGRTGNGKMSKSFDGGVSWGDLSYVFPGYAVSIVATSGTKVYYLTDGAIHTTDGGGGPQGELVITRSSAFSPLKSVVLASGSTIDIPSPNKGYEVYNVLGQIVIYSNNTASSLNTGGLSPGLYQLIVNNQVSKFLLR